MGHHRATRAALAEAFSKPTGLKNYNASRAVAAVPMAVPLRSDSFRSYSYPTWAGRPVSKWCRYGYWNEDGTELTVTRSDVKRARFL